MQARVQDTPAARRLPVPGPSHRAGPQRTKRPCPGEPSVIAINSNFNTLFPRPRSPTFRPRHPYPVISGPENRRVRRVCRIRLVLGARKNLGFERADHGRSVVLSRDKGRAVAATFPDQVIWWVGYSFGAAMSVKALSAQMASEAAASHPERCLLIAPPNGVMPMPELSSPDLTSRMSVIAGDEDTYVDINQLACASGIETTRLPAADHFFSGQHAQLQAAVSAWAVQAGQT